MRMNDYEYDFVQDSIDKKNVAHSARHARTHCGKSGRVRLPSDNLTKKELKAMSGEVIKYASLKNPMSWKEFKELPADLKVIYIKSIRDRFGAPDKYIAEMLGVSYQTLNLYLTDLKCNAGKGAGNGNKKWEKEKFYAWRSGADENLVEGTAAVETVDASEVDEGSEAYSQGGTETVPCYPEIDYAPISELIPPPPVIPNGYPVIPVIPKSGSMSFEDNRVDDILQTISTLLDGAGVRINCTISWEVVATSGSCRMREE